MASSVANARRSDRFRLEEFSAKYLVGQPPVTFTEQLEFFNSGLGGKSMPIYRECDSNGEFLQHREQQPFSKDFTLKIYQTMLKLNVMDKILYEAQRQGRISFYMTTFGEEACQIGSAAALLPRDLVYGQYREAGVLIWRGFTSEQCINQCYGNSRDAGKGKQMPVHYGSRDLNFITISSPLATQIPQAVGSAYSFKIAGHNTDPARRDDEGRVVCVYFGEGAFSEGDAHAGMNFAATLKCPVIFFCRNNGYAISTPTSEQYSGDGIAGKALGYGMDTIRVDGNDLFAVFSATSAARSLALEQNRPVLIEAMTYRVGHHSTSDDSSAYRSPKEVARWSELDLPIQRFQQYLERQGWWNQQKDKDFISTARSQVQEEFSRLEKVQRLPPDEVFFDVYAELPEHLQKQRVELRDHLANYGENYSLDAHEPLPK